MHGAGENARGRGSDALDFTVLLLGIIIIAVDAGALLYGSLFFRWPNLQIIFKKRAQEKTTTRTRHRKKMGNYIYYIRRCIDQSRVDNLDLDGRMVAGQGVHSLGFVKEIDTYRSLYMYISRFFTLHLSPAGPSSSTHSKSSHFCFVFFFKRKS